MKRAAEKTKLELSPLPLWWLAGCVVLYAALTSLLIFRVPIQAEPARTASGLTYDRTAPDESAHLEYVEYLATRGELPVFQPLGATQPGYEFHQPPLYYAVCALPWRVLDGGAAAKYFCRLFSMLCGAATLVLLWLSAAALFPSRRFLPLLATGFAALWPLHINVGAAAGPDALTGFWCAAIFYLVARGAKQHRAGKLWDWRDSLWMGGVLGLCLLTKNTGLVLAPVALGAAWVFTLPTRGEESTPEAKSLVFSAVLVLMMTGVLVGGWWARNIQLYGDPLAMSVFNQAFGQSSPGPSLFLDAGVPLSTYLRALGLLMFSTFWGFFGGPNTAAKVLNVFGAGGVAPEGLTALPLILICIAAMLVAFVGIGRAFTRWPKIEFANRAAILLWVCGAGLVVLAWMQFNTQYFQAQARYLHPAALPMALALAVGWHQLWRDSPRRILWNIGSAIFALTLLALTLWNAFGWRTLV